MLRIACKAGFVVIIIIVVVVVIVVFVLPLLVCAAGHLGALLEHVIEDLRW